MVLYRKNPSGKRLKYKRPDIWENKTKEEIKETLLHIINMEGIEPFVKDINQEKSSIDEFLEENEYLLDKSLEELTLQFIKNNIDYISEYIYNYNAVGIDHCIKFDTPVYINKKNKKSSNFIFISIRSELYNWSENENNEKYFYNIHFW